MTTGPFGAALAMMVPLLAGQPGEVAFVPPVPRVPVMAVRAMAATSQPLATQAALEIMRAGGSALDAAIAANAVLGLTEPVGCGIGGDLFAIVWDPQTQRLHGYNGSGRSAAAANLARVRASATSMADRDAWHLSDVPRQRRREQIPAFGPLPVTVPGAVDGWFALHERFGRLPMEQVLAPAVRYAQDGFPVSPGISRAWQASVRRFGGNEADFPGFDAIFTIADAQGRRAPRAGEIFRNPSLGDMYERLGREGRDAFYAGRVPAAVEATLAPLGGLLAASDFASHCGEWVEPVSASYRGVEVWQLPPNGQGIAALQILKIMEGYDVRSMGFGSAAYVHAFVEAKKLAFEDRARYFADPAFVRSPVRTLISAQYAARRRELIDPDRAARVVEPGVIPSGADTTYLTTADDRGMMVSLIQSNYRGMGSGMVPSDAHGPLGFMLQNRGEQFALVEGHPNVVAPGKRPFHTIIPGFITKDGAPWVSFGVMGGAMQPQGHAQIVMNLVDFGMDLQAAGDAPRIHHDGSTEPQGLVRPMSDGGVLNLEPGFAPAVLEALRQKGHTIRPASTAVFGGYQAIMRDPKTGVLTGASESRKDGQAAGF